MRVFDCGPLKYDINELEKRFSDISNYRKIDFDRLIEKTQGLAEPRAVYTYVEVAEIEGDNVHLRNGAKFKSIILGDLLKQGQNVAPYVATIGFRLDDELSKMNKNKMESHILERMGIYALDMARRSLKDHVGEVLGNSLSSFSPGSGTGRLFELKNQSILFQILQPQENIGVKLTPSFLMTPKKTSSGIFAAVDEEYVACQYCPRECEYREVSYTGEYVSPSR